MPADSDEQSRRLEVVLEAHRRFHDLRVNGSMAMLGEMLRFDYATGGTNPAYGWQEPEFTRELVNAQNHFVVWLNRLAAWEQIIAQYDEENAYSLTFEFVEMPLDYCLHFPYRFKQRITFCATQLCYIVGIAEKRITKEAVDEEDRMTLASLKKVAKLWREGPALVEAIERIDGKEFRQKSGEYRRKAQHRFPPRLAFGEVAYVQRSFPAGYLVRYSFKVAHPIQVGNVLPVLAKEAEYARAAFLAYRALVDEQCGG